MEEHFDWFKPLPPFRFYDAPQQIPVQTKNGHWWVGGAQLYQFPASDNFVHLKTMRSLGALTPQQDFPLRKTLHLFVDSADNLWAAGFGFALWEHERQTWRNLETLPEQARP